MEVEDGRRMASFIFFTGTSSVPCTQLRSAVTIPLLFHIANLRNSTKQGSPVCNLFDRYGLSPWSPTWIQLVFLRLQHPRLRILSMLAGQCCAVMADVEAVFAPRGDGGEGYDDDITFFDI